MPPSILSAVRNYRNAIAYAPTPGFPSRQPPGTGRRASKRFHGPIPSPYIGVADGDGLGGVWAGGEGLAGIWDDAKAAGAGLLAPATEKLDRLEGAIKMILILSGIAALTGVVNVVRR